MVSCLLACFVVNLRFGGRMYAYMYVISVNIRTHSSKLVFVTHTSILSTHIHDGPKRDQTHLHAAVNNRISVRLCTSMFVNIR